MRVEGWEHRLADLIVSAQTRDFAYGTWDCCLFAAAAIQALTAQDVSANFRGRCVDEDTCNQMLAGEGGVASLAARLAAECGFERIPPLMAQRGDIVLGQIRGRDTLGVCVGNRVAFAMAPRGLDTVPITSRLIAGAWRVD